MFTVSFLIFIMSFVYAVSNPGRLYLLYNLIFAVSDGYFLYEELENYYCLNVKQRSTFFRR